MTFFFKAYQVTCCCTKQLLTLATPKWKWFNGMSVKCTRILHAQEFIRSRFCFCKDHEIEEGKKILAEMFSWCHSLFCRILLFVQVWHYGRRHFGNRNDHVWDWKVELRRTSVATSLSWLDLMEHLRTHYLSIILWFIIYFTLNGTIIDKINIILYFKRQEISGLNHNLIINLLYLKK